MGRVMIESAFPEQRGKVHPTAKGLQNIEEFLRAGHSLDEARLLWGWLVKNPKAKCGATCLQDRHAFFDLATARRRLQDLAAEDAGRGPEGMKLPARPQALRALAKLADRDGCEAEELLEQARRRWGPEADWPNSKWANFRDDLRHEIEQVVHTGGG